MRKTILYTTTLILALNFISCRSTKDMRFFQNLKSEQIQGKPVKAPEYLIRTYDNLYIDVQSMNAEVNQLFSTSKSNGYSGGTSSEYGQVSSQYLNGYRVKENGTIVLPVIGEVMIVGLSEESAKEVIQKKIDEYFKDATVKVKILTYKVTLLGEVKIPGVYYNYNKSLTILDALGMANGTTDYASVRKVLVIRPTESGTKSFRVDLTDKNLMASEAYYIFPNDVLYVEPDRYKNFSLNSTVYNITISVITTSILILTFIYKK
jgi:polysaccharide export outer membrane protein